MRYLIARLGEPSSYAALAAMLAGFGLQIPPGIVQNVTLACTGIAGLAGVLLKDKGAA